MRDDDLCPSAPTPQRAIGTATTAWIGGVPLHGDLILAPMIGYSDLPFRTICRELGSAASITPCVLDEGLVRGTDRSLAIADYVESERPVGIQIIGRDEERLLEAGRAALALRPDWIDVNMGCPAKKVSGKGRGAALLKEPERAGQIMAALVGSLPVPVTAKIRLGWDAESLNYLEVAATLADAGASAITVHGRTKVQGYSGGADWSAIAAVRRTVSIPVIANGDVRTTSDIAAIQAATGCVLVMIGRGAIGNPWIFGRRDAVDVPPAERAAMMRRHLEAMRAYYGPRIGMLLFRKHSVRYVQYMTGVRAWRRAFGSAGSAKEVHSLIDRLEASPSDPPDEVGGEAASDDRSAEECSPPA